MALSNWKEAIRELRYFINVFSFSIALFPFWTIIWGWNRFETIESIPSVSIWDTSVEYSGLY